MGRIEKVRENIHDAFEDKLGAEFFKVFHRRLTTYYDWIEMRLVSKPTNGKPFTIKQKAWVAGYSEGYGQAMSQIGADQPPRGAGRP